MEETMKERIKSMMEDESVSFNKFYNYLHNEGTGEWDAVNSETILRQYISEKMGEGIHVSHMFQALEENPSKEECYEIWLGNSMETPTPINTKKDLVEALEIDLKEEKEK